MSLLAQQSKTFSLRVQCAQYIVHVGVTLLYFLADPKVHNLVQLPQTSKISTQTCNMEHSYGDWEYSRR